MHPTLTSWVLSILNMAQLAYPHKAPPYAILAACRLTGMDIKLQADLAMGKDSAPTLSLPDGYGNGTC